MKTKTLKFATTLLLPFVFFLLSIPSSAQTIQNDVLVSSGGTTTAGGIKMEFSVGEPVIETFEVTEMTLTQGFLQPLLIVTSIEKPDMLMGISVFPNPVKAELSIDIPQEFSSQLVCRLFDMTGKMHRQKGLAPGINALDMQDCASGNYLLSIFDTESGRKFQTKIIKIR
jgi:hypothetical protein